LIPVANDKKTVSSRPDFQMILEPGGDVDCFLVALVGQTESFKLSIGPEAILGGCLILPHNG
jgi:hypothetical protein